MGPSTSQHKLYKERETPNIFQCWTQTGIFLQSKIHPVRNNIHHIFQASPSGLQKWQRISRHRIFPYASTYCYWVGKPHLLQTSFILPCDMYASNPWKLGMHVTYREDRMVEGKLWWFLSTLTINYCHGVGLEIIISLHQSYTPYT
jgi:hypothetical protein